MDKFIPQSPDPFLKKEADMTGARFGHINAIVDEINKQPLRYVAKMVQATAKTNPAVIELETTIGSISWVRSSEGVFIGTSSMTFDPITTYANVCLKFQNYGGESFADISVQSGNTIIVQVYDLTGNFTDEFSLDLKVEIYT